MKDLKITPIEKNGNRVLTTVQLAEAYGTDVKIISNNFNRNIDRYTEGKHYYRLTGNELREFKTIHQIDESLIRVNVLYLWTEKGALLHAKSLNTDKAWEVYDFLVDHYFRTTALRGLTNEQLYNVRVIMKEIVDSELDERIGALEKKIENIVRKVTDEKMKNMIEEVIKAMDEKSEKIASDTCVTLRPAFIQLHEKINDTNKKFEKFSANFASEISGRLRPYFRSLDTKIKSFTKSSDRKSESISKAVGDNTKLMSAYLDTLADMLK